MKRISTICAFILLVGLACRSDDIVSPGPPRDLPRELTASEIAFTGANVITMENEGTLSGHTVVVRSGRIAAVAPDAQVTVPDSVPQIDASGWYLMPGLADMHIHMTTSGQYSSNDLRLFLANGVTTIRVMWGGSTYLQWRGNIANKQLLGPQMFVASPGMDGPPSYWPTPAVTTAADGRQKVATYHQAGYDFIKVYNRLSVPVYNAITAEARSRGIPIIGHIPGAVGFSGALAAQQVDLEHLIGYANQATTSGSLYSWNASFNEQGARLAAERTVAVGAWNCPTLAVQSRSRNDLNALQNQPGMRYVSPTFFDWLHNSLTQPGVPSQRTIDNKKRMAKVLQDAGAGLLIGTDTGVQYVLPGYSIHEELQLWVDAGLTPFEALRGATVNAAAFLNRSDDFGKVATGQRADLVLLKANPLQSVGNLQKRAGVMAAGHWFSQERLSEMLEELARLYGR